MSEKELSHSSYSGEFLTVQYSMTGSMTCFHTASRAACSSLDFAINETKPPTPGVELDSGAPKSELEGESSSVNVPPSGDNTAEGGIEPTGSDCWGSIFWTLKNADMKVYSAVALSMNTSRSDRTKASTWSF